jgi:hypothetical protein
MALATVTSANVKQAVPYFGVTNMETLFGSMLMGSGSK